jgi:hypothetical protein
MATYYSAFSSSIALAASATLCRARLPMSWQKQSALPKQPGLLEAVAGFHFLFVLETDFATLTAQETLPESFDSGAG